jgi:Ca2+-binding EF-hand superfamily protein
MMSLNAASFAALVVVAITRGVSAEGEVAEEVEEQKQTLGETLLTNFDTDGDGKISLVELLEHVNAAPEKDKKKFANWNKGFKDADKDGDLHLTAQELDDLFESAKNAHKEDFNTWVDSYSQSATDKWDTDKDARISYMEFTEHMVNNPQKGMNVKALGSAFRDADENNDHFLDAAELKSFLTHIGKQARGEHTHDPKKTLGDIAASNLDRDGDGKVSLHEFTMAMPHDQKVGKAFKGWTTGFKDADKDGDQHLTVEELDAMLNEARKGHKVEFSEWLDVYANDATKIWDTDEDGRISYMEFTEHMMKNKKKNMNVKALGQAFKEADGDNDLHLDPDELKAFLTKVSEQTKGRGGKKAHDPKKSLGEVAMANFDKDGDGKVSLHEFTESIPAGKAKDPAFKGWTKGFKDADTDNDMHLTVEELDALLNNVKENKQDDFAEWLEAYTKKVYLEWDTDKDGQISYMEFTESMASNDKLAKSSDFKKMSEQFKAHDLDGDLMLNEDELKTFLTKIGKNARAGRAIHDDGSGEL